MHGHFVTATVTKRKVMRSPALWASPIVYTLFQKSRVEPYLSYGDTHNLCLRADGGRINVNAGVVHN